MDKYILAIDSGTTSTRATLFDKLGNMIGKSQKEITQIFKNNGWVEHDPIEIWTSVVDSINEIMIKNNISLENIEAIGITNQRETTVLFDKVTKKPVYNAVVWQSRQSQDICNDLINKGYENIIKDKTGLLINPYFSATKIRWILDNVKEAKKLYDEDRLLFGTIDTWIIYNLTNGYVHATDVSNASRTMLYNINTNEWDKDILNILDIKSSILPKVYPSSHLYGYATKLSFLTTNINIPITAVLGDQQASLFGHCCFNDGDVKNTYGTGCFMLMNTGSKIVKSDNGLLSTIAWQIDDKITYALEGSVFVAGSVVQWIRDGLKMIDSAKDSEYYCNKVKDTNGVYIVPAFTGLGTPYWDNDARGAVFGLTRGTTKEHFIRAIIESIAYQNKDVLNIMIKESELENIKLYADGGATTNNFLMQFQADILGINVILPVIKETTALGAAYMAGLTTKFYKDLDYIKKIHHLDSILHPTLDKEEIDKLYSKWLKAIEATRIFK